MHTSRSTSMHSAALNNDEAASKACAKSLTYLSLQPLANVAQLVEQLIRNEQVTGSSPVIGSNTPLTRFA